MTGWGRIGIACVIITTCAAACANDEAPPSSNVTPDAGLPDAATEAEEQPSAISPTCALPPDCIPVVSPFVNIGVCCGPDLRCGLDFSILVGNIAPEEAALLGFDPAKPCWPRGKVYFEEPGSPEERIPSPGGDILITPECKTRNAANTPLIGCCLPGGECGLSTHEAASSYSALSEGADEPFTRPECVSVEELNAQLLDSVLAAWGHIPATPGKCDYEGLNARLPRQTL